VRQLTDSTWLAIECCWIAWLVYWVITAFATKRTIERRGFIGYRLVAALAIAARLAAERLLHVSSQSRLWQTTLAHFPEAHAEYKMRVRAIIAFVL